jgi:hypothetical protein
MLSARANAMLVSSVHSPGAKPWGPPLRQPVYGLERARRPEFDGCAQGIAHSQTDQAATLSTNHHVQVSLQQ